MKSLLQNFMIMTFLIIHSGQVFSQTNSNENTDKNTEAITLPDITVLGDLSKKSTLDFVPTVSEISGQKLQRKKQTSLGETLGKEVGISSSFFGPNASRPVIRGLDGERIRILNDGTGVLDASAASQDHEVAIEPISIERIEIVRGAASLLYGSSAVGGVVNTVTNRIPEKSSNGFNGKFDTNYSSVDSGNVKALGLNYGAESFALHFDGSARKASDYKIPGFARTAEKRAHEPLDPEDQEGYKKVINSDNKTYSGALGGSYLFKDGFAGASFSKYKTDYGTVAEQKVKINLNQQKTDVAFGLKNLGFIESLKFKNTYSDYKHSEIEDGEVGTVFTNRGNEARLELKHQKVGVFQGLFGLQSNVFAFEAIGDEKFLPKTDNQSLAAFLFEEAEYGSFKPSFGLRFDNSSVKADQTFIDVDPNNLGEATEGGPSVKKTFSGNSASLGLLYNLNTVQALALNLSYTERAPNYQELFANGPHLATGAFERGNSNLEKEKAQSIELSYRHKEDNTKGSATVFLQNFKDFISLSPKAGGGFAPDGAPGNRDLALYQYEAVNARFYGFEAEITHNLQALIPEGVTELGFKFDTVKAKNTQTQENIPRITPTRETVSASYKANKYSLDAEIQHVEKQNNLAPNETATDGYTLTNIGVDFPIRFDSSTFSLYARINNLFNIKARNHVSVLKDIAPLPGRNIIAGLQATF